jgi:FkbM family methyltransferase
LNPTTSLITVSRSGRRSFEVPRMRELIKRTVLRGIRAAGYDLTHLPLSEPADLSETDAALAEVGRQTGNQSADAAARGTVPASGISISTNSCFAEVDSLLAQVIPWSGQVPDGYTADFLGIFTEGRLLWDSKGPFGGTVVSTQLPTLASYGEAWLEVADWFFSARAATGHYVAISLGAAFGAQLVGAWKVLRAINPLPAKLVAVEPVPQNCASLRRHMAFNGIDPNEHWILQAALGADNDPLLFPVGAHGAGPSANSGDSNSKAFRQTLADSFRLRGQSGRVLKNILLYNSTGVVRDLGAGYSGEVKFVSALKLEDVLWPFDRVDLLEVDIQSAEAQIIPPRMELLTRKVRRVHIGTHGRDIHVQLRALFSTAGWEIIFDFAPDAVHTTERGSLTLGDGVLTARNPIV